MGGDRRMTDASNRAPTIAVVDDEEVVTRTIATFLGLETDYDVHTFQSPAAALEAMDRTHADLVISDFLMPEMNGLEFLAEVKRRYPETVRILLTGYADKESAIRAINEVEIFQYIEKPWDNDQLAMVIRNGLRNRSLSHELGTRIDELDRTVRRHERLSQQHERLKEELVLARRVQQTLLPQLGADGRLRFSASYRPALEVGGDFYDVIELSGGRRAAFVADATGHGVQAALSTTLLKSTFTRFAGTEASAAGMLRDMNRALHDVLPSEIFVAATLATIDPATGTLCVTNGGGPHPFHLPRAGGVRRVPSNGLFLGAVEPSLYEPGDEIEVTLEPGDRVVFYTDGLTEIENDDGADFGDGTILDALDSMADAALEDIGGGLLSRADAHAREDHEWDDVTILAMEFGDDDAGQ
jgi:serine phosphatase RsbU (regulator of sigma subunit)